MRESLAQSYHRFLSRWAQERAHDGCARRLGKFGAYWKGLIGVVRTLLEDRNPLLIRIEVMDRKPRSDTDRAVMAGHPVEYPFPAMHVPVIASLAQLEPVMSGQIGRLLQRNSHQTVYLLSTLRNCTLTCRKKLSNLKKMAASITNTDPIVMRAHHPLWQVAAIMLVVVTWLAGQVGCWPSGLTLQRHAGAQQFTSHSTDSCCGLSGPGHTFAARSAPPGEDGHLGAVPPQISALPPAPAVFAAFVALGTPHVLASFVPRWSPRHFTPRWTQAPPSLI